MKDQHEPLGIFTIGFDRFIMPYCDHTPVQRLFVTKLRDDAVTLRQWTVYITNILFSTLNHILFKISLKKNILRI